jgi:DNA-binding transcriptional regulator YiaG
MSKVFEDLKNGTVRYTGCGLDYVILQNGFTLKTFGKTTAISITDVDALWDAIARTIVASKPTVEGQDVRFLRGKLGLTQDELAQAFGITRQAVIGWEQKRNKAVPNSPAHLLRLLYDAQTNSGIFGSSSIESLTNLNSAPMTPIAPFEHQRTNWQQAKRTA